MYLVELPGVVYSALQVGITAIPAFFGLGTGVFAEGLASLLVGWDYMVDNSQKASLRKDIRNHKKEQAELEFLISEKEEHILMIYTLNGHHKNIPMLEFELEKKYPEYYEEYSRTYGGY